MLINWVFIWLSQGGGGHVTTKLAIQKRLQEAAMAGYMAACAQFELCEFFDKNTIFFSWHEKN